MSEVRRGPDIQQPVKQKRRVFLKVFAAGPLVACAGTDPGGGSGGEGATAGKNSGGSENAGGSLPTSGGTPPTSGGTGSSSGGNPFSSGGNPFGSAGRFGDAPGGSASGGQTSSGGSGVGTGGSTNPGEVVANVSAIAVGSFQIVGGLFFMGRDAGGLWAMSLQCTHKFCAVVVSGNELDCPCHHSRFDRAGNVLQGPATTPLPRYKVYVDAAGNISVDKYTIVSAATRTPV